MEAYSSAVQAGISPVEFWQLTPYLTKVAIPALLDGRTTQIWTQAALGRTKKMPKLEKLLSKKDEPQDVNTKLKDVLLSYNKNVREKRKKKG